MIGHLPKDDFPVFLDLLLHIITMLQVSVMKDILSKGDRKINYLEFIVYIFRSGPELSCSGDAV